MACEIVYGEAYIKFTRHAEDMLTERGIERGWVERTINEPDESEPDHARPNVTRAFRSVPERGGRVLRVVYSTIGNEIRVITAFFDRARRSR